MSDVVTDGNERERPQPPWILKALLPSVLFLLFIPLVMMVVISLRDETGWAMKWYVQLFQDPVLISALLRSLAVAGVSALLATILSILNSLAMQRWLKKFSWYLNGLSMASLMLPELVLGLSLLSWFALTGVSLSLLTVMIAHATLTLPFVTLVILARLGELDSSIEDAARDLGASEAQVLRRVTLPLLVPAIMGGYVLAFLLSFDDFLVTFFTNGAGQDTLPVLLYSQMKTGMTPKIQALSSLMLAISIGLLTILLRMRRSSIVS